MPEIVPEASRYEVRAVADIRVGERHRKAMGDLEALGASILDVGLLNPVTVDTTGLLLAGERRLRAMRDVLGWEWVPVHVVDADALVVEQTENEQRQALTIAERYGLGQAMAARLGNRQGKRTDLPGQLPQQIAEVRGKETREIAARAAGFGNRETYRQAVTIVEKGVPELAQAVDEGRLTVSAAAKVATLPEKQQRAAIAEPRAHVANNSGDMEWWTPAEIVEAARVTMGTISLDPASCKEANAVVKAERYFTEKQDGLAQQWNGAVYMNPPFATGLIGPFCDKLLEEYQAGRVTQAVVLVNNATETRWFQALAGKAAAICFPAGRVRFWHPRKVSVPLQGQAILYFGSRALAFAAAFRTFGVVYRAVR